METYKNNYKKQEDHALWELHEIRHALHRKLKNKSTEQINQDALKKYKSWQRGVSGNKVA